MSIIQQLEDLKEWSQDSTRYERRLAFRDSYYVPPKNSNPDWIHYPRNDPGAHKQILEDFDTTRETMHAEGGSVPQLVQPGPGRQGYEGKKFIGGNQAGTYVTANKPGRPLETKPLIKKEILRLKKNLPEGITMHETSSGVWNYRFKIQKGKNFFELIFLPCELFE